MKQEKTVCVPITCDGEFCSIECWYHSEYGDDDGFKGWCDLVNDINDEWLKSDEIGYKRTAYCLENEVK